jgi:hypothetical protein
MSSALNPATGSPSKGEPLPLFVSSPTEVDDVVSRLLRVTEQIWGTDIHKASSYVKEQLVVIVSSRAMQSKLLRLRGGQAEEVVTIMQMVSLF